MEGLGVSPRFWLDRPALVTGATGLLGSWLVRSLLQAGSEVVCLVRDWVPQCELVRSGLIERVNIVRGDVRDRDLVERLLGEYEIDSVFHLAAQTIVGIANRNPISTFETNVQGAWTVLEACRRSPAVKAVIVASSDKAYGTRHVLPYTEDAPLQGEHPYDVSKSCADLISHAFFSTFQLPVAITRCGNLYGGGDLNWSRLVPGVIRSVLRGERPVIRSDGEYLRDYFYVEDAAAAYMLLAERVVKDSGVHGMAFNFSNESPLTVLQVVQRILAAMGSSLEPKICNEACHEIRAQYLSAVRSREILNWTPLFTLDGGLRRTIDWYRAHFARGEAAHV